MFSDTNLHYTAKVISDLLDPDRDGKIEDGSDLDKIRNSMNAADAGLIIGGGVSSKDEETCPNLSAN